MNTARLTAIAAELRNFDESHRSAAEGGNQDRSNAAESALLGALTSAVTVILEELTDE